MYFLAAGVLSAVSDNVFVGTVYITQAKQALSAGLVTREQFDLLAVAINTGTNITERRHAERPGSLPVPPDVGAGPADPPVLRGDGLDGTARTPLP